MIGIQLAGKKNNIPASVFMRSLNSFYDLINDVDSMVSKQSGGSVRWELATLQKSSPAVVEFVGQSRIEKMDYSQAIQESVFEGIEQLAERPEQPQFYSYSALTKVKRMAEQAQFLKWLTVYTGNRRVVVDKRVSNNVEYIIGYESKSLGSVRGSLDALMVHRGHEFRVWSPKRPRPITCRFSKEMLPEVIAHIKQQVEVIGELHRNQKGEPTLVDVQEFRPLEPVKASPTIEEMCGLVPDLYGGQPLKDYLEELRNG
ncbi:MAG: hypothetical protein ABSG13_17510 [Bryobacteraceae bacterium]